MERYIIRFLEYRSDKYAYLNHLPKNSKVLDIGCGDCRRLRYRSYFRDDLVNHGIDIHKDSRCNNYLKTFHKLDIRKDRFPFEEGYFNLVVISHVIEHLPKNDFRSCMKEIYRVLRRGGYVYIELPSYRTQHFIAAKTLNRFTFPVTTLNFYDDETHISLYSLQELVDILEEEVFSVYSYGDIREPVKKILSPLLLLAGYLLRDKSIFTGSLWSVLNWASFVVARK